MMAVRKETVVVLIVDDVPDNLAVLHDALDESGYMVLVANNGEAALARAEEARPDIILLDAIMPSLDGFEVCTRLKANLNTRHIPVIFMTGLTESEHVVAGFAAGGADYVTKPIRTTEVLARISTHLQASRQIHQTRGALDAFGQAAIAILPGSGRIVWQTPLARDWMTRYFTSGDLDAETHTPAIFLKWLDSVKTSGMEVHPLTVVQGGGRLVFSPADLDSEEQWIILLREESDAAQTEALMQAFGLTQRESEVLYWVIRGKTNRDIGDILGTSPRTINKHMEHVFAKLGVETRTAAASLATSKMRSAKAG
ncbi:two component transcriptional regulator, LuxR family [Methylobacillus rhizosphaerae]|uniref:Two component transcriptional regulator, LuxR family n=1 Tax=Methylobacillus rhizosphaerae TaxID=551994 RepID=A0A238YFA9_9PROT|nr:response regulator transcription factor [Methylobacillus rhizosphaerae]SNR69662.1 two component transcriptional regulator, LuxR family [Methylobacillus rhizosphaerae]